MTWTLAPSTRLDTAERHKIEGKSPRCEETNNSRSETVLVRSTVIILECSRNRNIYLLSNLALSSDPEPRSVVSDGQDQRRLDSAVLGLFRLDGARLAEAGMTSDVA